MSSVLTKHSYDRSIQNGNAPPTLPLKTLMQKNHSSSNIQNVTTPCYIGYNGVNRTFNKPMYNGQINNGNIKPSSTYNNDLPPELPAKMNRSKSTSSVPKKPSLNKRLSEKLRENYNNQNNNSQLAATKNNDFKYTELSNVPSAVKRTEFIPDPINKTAATKTQDMSPELPAKTVSEVKVLY